MRLVRRTTVGDWSEQGEDEELMGRKRGVWKRGVMKIVSLIVRVEESDLI